MNTSNGAWLSWQGPEVSNIRAGSLETYLFQVHTMLTTDRKGNTGSAQVWLTVRRYEEEAVTMFTYQIETMNFYSLFFFVDQYQELLFNWIISSNYTTRISQADRAFAGEHGPIIKVNGKTRLPKRGTDIEVVK
jgi:hypothetical protein